MLFDGIGNVATIAAQLNHSYTITNTCIKAYFDTKTYFRTDSFCARCGVEWGDVGGMAAPLK